MFTTIKIETGTYYNLIVNSGVNVFLSNMIGNSSKISKICFGKGTTKPTVNDINLENIMNETSNIKYEISKRSLILTATVNGGFINGSTEIGVKSNNNTLISRNVHDEINVPTTATVRVKYIYSIQVAEYVTGWSENTPNKNVFQLTETLRIGGVIETTHNVSYGQKNSIDEVVSEKATFYQDDDNIYIHTSNESNPNILDLMFIYRGE